MKKQNPNSKMKTKHKKNHDSSPADRSSFGYRCSARTHLTYLILNYFKIIVTILLVHSAKTLVAGDLTLAGIFTNNAVIQRNASAPVWGWGDPGEQVTVTFAGQTHTATADSSGKWLVRLTPLGVNAHGQTLQVQTNTANRSVSINNVVIGDVWLCSGQSNMAWVFWQTVAAVPELSAFHKNLNNPNLRFSSVPFPNPLPSEPLINVSAPWQTANKDTAVNVSAIGVLFGDAVQKALGIPIGILVSSRGGTNIETWTPSDIVLNNPLYATYQANTKNVGTQNQIGMMYNGMIAPIIDYAFAGVLWYQGEGNVWDVGNYDQRIANLISAWRTRSGRTDAPFIMSELAPLLKHTTDAAEKIAPIDLRPRDCARTRFGETLAKAARIDGRAWTITITDAGEKYNIHPVDKRVPAARFAAMALSKVYHQPGIAHGPIYQSMTVANGVANVVLDSVGSGLIAKTIVLSGHALKAETLEGFEIAGANKVFYRAQAAISSTNSVNVWHPEVPTPVAVRYAWANFPLCNLYNTEGFAAYPFRTDSWAWQTPADPAALKVNNRLAP